MNWPVFFAAAFGAPAVFVIVVFLFNRWVNLIVRAVTRYGEWAGWAVFAAPLFLLLGVWLGLTV